MAGRERGELSRAAAMVLALAASACGSIPEGVFACSADDDCPPGWACSGGRCYAEPQGGIDGGVEADASRDAEAADGSVCDAEICDNVDNDCDGSIDESGVCPGFFGRPSPLVAVHQSYADVHGMARLSEDGLRLYVTFNPGPTGTIIRSSRATPSAPFEAPTVVAGLAGVHSFGLSRDEREIFVGIYEGGNVAIHRAVRGDRDLPFEPPMRVNELSLTGQDYHPYLMPNGLDLYYTAGGGTSTVRAVRAAPGSPFTIQIPLDLRGTTLGDYTPFLTEDGLSLFFARVIGSGHIRVFHARRATPDSPFDDPAEVVGLNAPDLQTISPFVSVSTREIFFVSNRPWSAAAFGIWRAQLCRTGPCVEPTVDCPFGLRSEDQRHCYTRLTGPMAWADAEEACNATGGHLVSIHSPAEQSLTWTVANMMAAWSGGNDITNECHLTIAPCSFAWVTGEPFLYANWGGMEPNDGSDDEDCTVVYDGAGLWMDIGCSQALPSVCETDVPWPWW